MHKLISSQSPAESSRTSTQLPTDWWPFEESCIVDDADYFVKALSGIIDKGIQPNLIGPIITHCASKWLPDLISLQQHAATTSNSGQETYSSPRTTATATWMKKRDFVEKLVGILPNERNAVPCNFLLQLLRAASMVQAKPNCQAELEKRVACQLDRASLGDLMIPSFSYSCGTLLDVDLAHRIVRRFVELSEERLRRSGGGVAALIKVGKLIDSYLAEAAVDSNLTVEEFVGLAGALPDHARFSHDGLYRAIDTYLKVHSGLISKQEKKWVCRLLDSRKLSPEASLHAGHNDRLPARVIIKILLSEQTKLVSRQLDWSGSFGVTRSPNMCHDGPTRCQSKRESTAQQMEIKKLREDMMRIQKQCISIQAQMEKVLEKKKKKGLYFFHWKKLGSVAAAFRPGRVEEGVCTQGDFGFGRRTPVKPARTPQYRRRKSLS